MGAWIDRKSTATGAQFCPYCGVARPMIDEAAGNTCDYICQICFCGFRLSESPRVMQANRYFAAERSQRTERRMQHGIAPELKQEWDRVAREQGPVREKQVPVKVAGGGEGLRCWTEPSKNTKFQPFTIRYGTQ